MTTNTKWQSRVKFSRCGVPSLLWLNKTIAFIFWLTKALDVIKLCKFSQRITGFYRFLVHFRVGLI
jgi:hypothetical protein